MNQTAVKSHIRNLCLSGLFIALGVVLPFLTGQVPQIGRMLCPMHIPVLLCGLICAWPYGLAVGLITPLLRSILFGMPPLFPTALAMAFELAAYGAIVGVLYARSRWHCVAALYASMLPAMIGGRLVWGTVMYACMGLSGGTFTLQAFLAGAVLNSVPGILLQLTLIPAVMLLLDRTHLVPFRPAAAQADRQTGRAA